MRHALIIAGGSGTRLWPMSTKELPKQLIPFIDGRSLLQIAMDRLEGLVPDEQIHVCAGEATREVMLDKLHRLSADRFIGEPTGRDTLNAVALGTGVIAKKDPDATVAIFTADHLIEPEDKFREIVRQGYDAAEQNRDTLVTFGVEPTHPATGFGYLQLGGDLGEGGNGGGAKVVDRFREKPDADTAEHFYKAGPEKFLWNSGMFVWKASTLMDCVRRYAPDNHAMLVEAIEAWGHANQGEVLERIYPQLEKISVDYAVMEPASEDEKVNVAAVPMPLKWLDIGSWPAFGQTREHDDKGNATACKSVLMDCQRVLAASDDPKHAITAIGCEDLIVIHTGKATLVCRADRAQDIKKLHAEVGKKLGEQYL